MKNSFNAVPGNEDAFSKRPRFSRRELLAAGAAATLGLSVVGGPVLWEQGWDRLGRGALEKAITEAELDLMRRYGISIEVSGWSKSPEIETKTKGPETGYKYTSLDKKSLYFAHKAIEDIRLSLALYPPKKIGKYIEKIGLVKHISPPKGKDEPAGLTVYGFGKSDIYLTIDKNGVSSYLDAVLGGGLVPYRNAHHEIAHAVMKSVSQSEWGTVAPGQKYLGDRWKTASSQETAGFATTYGTSNWEDDIATTAERMFPRNHVMESNAGDSIDGPLDNPVLQKKIAFLKKQYQEKLGLDEKYWKALHNGEVDEEYWSRTA